MAKRKRRLLHSNLKGPSHELDIVIPVYGQADMLRECLTALDIAAFDVDYQLFIVDDQGPEQEKLNLIYSSLNSDSRVLRNKHNRGFPATTNRGASLGNSPAILFLNSDVTMQAGSIRAMLKMLWSDEGPKGPIDPGQDSQVGIVAPKLLFPEKDDIPPEARGKVQHAGLAINAQGRPFHIHKLWSSDNPRLNQARAMQAVSGACLMTRREVWNQVAAAYRKSGDPSTGGFNEIYGLGTWEDVEYSFAVRGNGYRVVYEPVAVGYHYAGASVRQRGDDGYPLSRNQAIFMARCGHLLFWDEWLFW